MFKMPDRLFKTFHYTNKSKLGKVGLVALINSYPSNNNNNKNHTHKKNGANSRHLLGGTSPHEPAARGHCWPLAAACDGGGRG